MPTGYSTINIEARVSSTFFLKTSSSKALGPWLYTAFISAVNEVGVDNSTKWHLENLNCEKKKRNFRHQEMKSMWSLPVKQSLVSIENWPIPAGTAAVAIWSNTDEGVWWRDEEKMRILRTQALCHTAPEPDRGGVALSDSAAHLKALQTNIQISPLRKEKTNG